MPLLESLEILPAGYFFVREGAGNGPCNLERLEICIILVKSMDLMGSLDE